MEDRNIVDLDELVLNTIARKLDGLSLAKLACTCRELKRVASGQPLWQDLCLSRWKSRGTSLWSSLSATGDYRALFAKKHQLDHEALQLMARLEFQRRSEPSKALLELYNLGPDIMERLRLEEEVAEDPHRKGVLLDAATHVQGRRAAVELHRLAVLPPQEIMLDEGCLLMTQVYFPLSDLSAIPRFFDDMAAELKARMAAAGVEGGVEALKLLSHLLFAPPDEGSQTDEGSGANVGGTLLGGRRWGPDQEGLLKVPRDGGSLGLKGNMSNYYKVDNSLLPNVVLTKQGLPITLCIIHAAIGRRAGLDIDGAGRPYHFVNRFVEKGSGYYIDCFNGGSIHQVWSNFPEEFPLAANPLAYVCPPTSVWRRCISNLLRLYDNLEDTFSSIELRLRDRIRPHLLEVLAAVVTEEVVMARNTSCWEYVHSTWPDPQAFWASIGLH